MESDDGEYLPPATPEELAAAYLDDLREWKAIGDIYGVWIMRGTRQCTRCHWLGCYPLNEAPAAPPDCEFRTGCGALWVPVMEGEFHPPWKLPGST